LTPFHAYIAKNSKLNKKGDKPADGNHFNHRAGQRYYPEGSGYEPDLCV